MSRVEQDSNYFNAVVIVDENGDAVSSLTTSGLTDTELRAADVAVTLAGESVAIGEALPPGTNNIGDVDVATVPAPLSTTGGGVEATALRVTVASDSTGVLSVDDNGASLTVDSAQLPAALAAGGGLKVEGVAGGVAVPTEDTWTPVTVSDVTDDDSDKTFTVPASTIWQPLALYVTLTTTADVGDRQLAVLFTDGSDNVLAEVRPQVVQAASLARKYSFALGNPDDLAFYDTDLLRVPLPLMTLPAGYKIRVYDNNAVAAAADDMLVQLTVLAR